MTAGGRPVGTALDRIRGSLERARANARTVAALTDNPGCARRRVIDAAGIRAYELASNLGHPVARGQSPFAITTGNRFEHRLKKGSGYTLLAEVLKPFVDLPTDALRCADLGEQPGDGKGIPCLQARARRTDDTLAAIARGDAGAPHLVDHPVLVFDLAGAPVYLEPDALALRVGSQLQLVEIKSYPIIDGQADPDKLAATGGQAAVYLLALRATLERLGFDPDCLRWSVILVAPKNFGRMPVAHEIPLRKKAAALRRVLGALPRVAEVVRPLPRGFTLDVDPAREMDEAQRRAALDQAVRRLPMLYVPECLASCDLAKYCRHRAIVEDDPSRLGRVARDTLAGVGTLAGALRLARDGAGPDEQPLSDVAAALQNAYRALQRARALSPPSCGLEPAPEAGEGARR